MSNGDLFYVCGSVLAVSAVVFAFVGLRLERFPGRMSPLVGLWFVVLIGATTTFSVLHAKDEEEHALAAEAAAGGHGVEEEGSAEASPTGKPSKERAAPVAKGPGGTLELAADPTQIAFDTTKLSSKPGKVTIDLANPSSLVHDVAIEEDGEILAASDQIAQGETSVSAELAPGEYTFLCTVPGHAEAGMQGTLTVG